MFQQYPHYFHKVFNIFLEEIHHFDHVMDIWEYLARLFQNLAPSLFLGLLLRRDSSLSLRIPYLSCR